VPAGRTARIVQLKATRKPWTMPEIARFRDMYHRSTRAELLREFGRSVSALRNMAVKLRLSKDYGIAIGFPKGNIPWNLGKRHPAKGRSSLTQFKRGQKPASYLPIGSERMTKDGIEIKIADARHWIPKTRYLWEQAHGPIPAGMIVRNTGDRDRFTLDDLRLMTRAENAALNAKIRKPKRKVIAAWIRPLMSAQEAQA